MLPSSRRRSRASLDIWPGFVDVLATVVLVFVFLLMLFVVSQFFLSGVLFQRDQTVETLHHRIGELSRTLALKEVDNVRLEGRVQALTATLQTTFEEREAALQAQDADRRMLMQIQADLTRERVLGTETQADLEQLQWQLEQVQLQLTALNQALEAREAVITAQRLQVENLGERLNIALADRVQELARYRSEFFGRLRESLADVEDIQIVGDRFRFQSELFFASGSADLEVEGQARLDRVAVLVREIEQRIPADIDWVLMVEGHTDRRPIRTEQFPSNWQLSTARAQRIVDYLIDRGVAPRRLAAAGYGEFHPLDPADTPAALARNRRIEMRLTSAPEQ
ncbi:peptidoglycan -binding protein [Ectothiorhodospira lacustris]|uniref:peptidoglycan -binding protein n=1 Tax=Ectothiorhodospira lacustris TaxID=2899127 RepID=UPI001EE9A2DB|nr:peptidoglycan -binding protein [Ectothiorhodospira lacustris]MCG5500635.1 peptidoglycan -binding protein [Ectothiorhodospira lacustris]MCG5508944.1 peptidoglycan -binding protein [Ectothiorhodospira lacustris]MCG5520735.1 peptidoglycan -binding protein [Ectothiorhodospira lacustris]